MQQRSLRYAVMLVIILLIVAQCLVVLNLIFDTVSGLIGAGIITAVYFYCGYRARAGTVNKIWFIVPTVLFIVVPAIARFFIASEDGSTVSFGYQFFLLMIDFVLPVLILLLVYIQLSKSAPHQP